MKKIFSVFVCLTISVVSFGQDNAASRVAALGISADSSMEETKAWIERELPLLGAFSIGSVNINEPSKSYTVKYELESAVLSDGRLSLRQTSAGGGPRRTRTETVTLKDVDVSKILAVEVTAGRGYTHSPQDYFVLLVAVANRGKPFALHYKREENPPREFNEMTDTVRVRAHDLESANRVAAALRRAAVLCGAPNLPVETASQQVAARPADAPKTGTTTNSRVEAQALNGQSYRTQDGRSAITLISSEELEYRVPDGTTFLCKYSSQQDALRVIMTVLGTQQVLYFRRVPNGLVSNDGVLYLSPSALAEVQRQAELANMRAVEQARVLAEEQAKERQRVAARVQESRTPKAVIFSSEEPAVLDRWPGYIHFVTKTTISDVSVTFVGTERIKDARPGSREGERVTDPFEVSYWFGETGVPSLDTTRWRFDKWDGSRLQMYVPYWQSPRDQQREIFFNFQKGAMSEPFVEALAKARQSWRAKYPDLIHEWYR